MIHIHTLPLRVLHAARSILFVALLGGFAHLCLTACGNDNPAPGSGSKIAVILKWNNTYWQQVAQGVTDAATQAGLTADILYANADVDPQGQLALLNALDLTQYKGIVIAPAHPDKMLPDIRRIAAQLPLVVIDSPIDPSAGYHAFVGMDNQAAGRQLHQEMMAYATAQGSPATAATAQGSTTTATAQGSPATATPQGSPATALIFQLEGSYAMAQRAEGLKLACQGYYKEVKNIIVPAQQPDMKAAFLQAIDAMNGQPYILFAANGAVADVLLATIKEMPAAAGQMPVTAIAAFDVTASILKSIVENHSVTLAQDNYGYGYEGVKAVLAPATGKSVMLAPKFINATNVNSPDVTRYLNGLTVPK